MYAVKSWEFFHQNGISNSRAFPIIISKGQNDAQRFMISIELLPCWQKIKIMKFFYLLEKKLTTSFLDSEIVCFVLTYFSDNFLLQNFY